MLKSKKINIESNCNSTIDMRNQITSVANGDPVAVTKTHTDLAVPVVFLENFCGPFNAFESRFLHGYLELFEHVVGEYAADDHVALPRVLDELLRQSVDHSLVNVYDFETSSVGRAELNAR